MQDKGRMCEQIKTSQRVILVSYFISNFIPLRAASIVFNGTRSSTVMPATDCLIVLKKEEQIKKLSITDCATTLK
jgi:hypothetical protein